MVLYIQKRQLHKGFKVISKHYYFPLKTTLTCFLPAMFPTAITDFIFKKAAIKVLNNILKS